MTEKPTSFRRSLLAASVLLAAGPAVAEPYIGVNLGSYTWREYNPSFIGWGATTKAKISEIMPGVHAGYMLTDWIGLEASYQKFPSGSGRTDDGVEVSMKGDAATLWIRPTLRSDQGELFLKFGVAFWDISSKVDTNRNVQPTLEESGDAFAWGIGAGWFIDEHWKIGLEAGGIEGEGAANLASWSISAAYHF